MSLTLNEFYLCNLDYAKKRKSWLYKLSARSLQKRFKISSNAAEVIHSTMSKDYFKSIIIPSLLAYAQHIKNNAFWKNFQLTPEYIFSEFARHNFFPLVHGKHVKSLRNAFVSIMNNTHNYEAVLDVVNPKARYHEDMLSYISERHRGTPEHLANLIIASLIIPEGLFDWKSCHRGEESENLMMFGIEAMNQKEFNKIFS